MKVNNTELLKNFKAIDNGLLGLVMQLMALSEAITARIPAEIQHHTKILQHLSNNVHGKLMQLHPEFE
jgi:hypothetical protein